MLAASTGRSEGSRRALDSLAGKADELTDPLEKQILLDEARAERRALAAAAKGCADVGEKLNVVLDFLQGFQDELASINTKLGALQSSIGALHESLDRALGRPVLAVLAEHEERQRQRKGASLESSLYIPIEGVVADERGKFEVGPGNTTFDLLHDASRGMRSFLGVKPELAADGELAEGGEVEEDLAEGDGGADEEHDMYGSSTDDELDISRGGACERPSTLLLAGAAGSGKSTFMAKLEKFLREDYTDARKRERPGIVVVLLLVQLGALTNPLTDLWNEGLRRQYRLTTSQCDELRTRVHDGQAEVLFLLDAYDELAASSLGKSLYQSNNLEQYRSHDERAANDYSNPRVIYTCRSELLASEDARAGRLGTYVEWFVPLESENEKKDEVDEVNVAERLLTCSPAHVTIPHMLTALSPRPNVPGAPHAPREAPRAIR